MYCEIKVISRLLFPQQYAIHPSKLYVFIVLHLATEETFPDIGAYLKIYWFDLCVISRNMLVELQYNLFIAVGCDTI